MRYLVWVPNGNAKADGAALLKSVGLEDHAKGFDAMPTGGPVPGSGYLFAWTDPTDNRVAYKPEEQTWIPSMADGDRPAGAYWVGIWNDKKPTETDVRRPEFRKGVWVTMADGTRWQFPSPSTLERFPDIKDGKLTWVVDEQFSWFVAEVDKRKAMLTFDPETPGKAFVSWDLEQDFAFLVRALRLNYRLTPEVVVHLRLISESILKTLTTAILGFVLTED